VLESLGEAFALVRKSGINPQRFLAILTGSLFSAPVYQTYGPIIAEEKISADGFEMSLGLKDVRLALAVADALPMPVASLVRDHFLEGVAQGEGDTDWSGLARLCARSAGL
jgi:3-hydroxyisobutyrate dehydrogenase-like beta-hydroxyacid dehydrogenase